MLVLFLLTKCFHGTKPRYKQMLQTQLYLHTGQVQFSLGFIQKNKNAEQFCRNHVVFILILEL